MSPLLVFVFLITANTFYVVEGQSVTLDCEKKGEVQVDCPATECLNDKCAKSAEEAKKSKLSCPAPEVCPDSICQCTINDRRLENGTCVPIEECPRFRCGKNEEYLTSPPFCSDDCEYATEDGNCHTFGRIGIILIKQQVCRCKKNYWRLDGVCVPYATCKSNTNGNLEDMPKVTKGSSKTLPVVQPKTVKSPKPVDPIETQTFVLPTTTTTEKPELNCPEGEVQDDCPREIASEYCPTSEQEAKTLKNLKQPEICPPSKCVCGFNKLRDITGKCINIRDCPAFDCSSGPYQAFNPCPPYCPGEGCESATPDGRCPPLFGILPVLQCYPSCHCIKGYWRKNGTCVPYAECGK